MITLNVCSFLYVVNTSIKLEHVGERKGERAERGKREGKEGLRVKIKWKKERETQEALGLCGFGISFPWTLPYGAANWTMLMRSPHLTSHCLPAEEGGRQ